VHRVSAEGLSKDEDFGETELLLRTDTGDTMFIREGLPCHGQRLDMATQLVVAYHIPNFDLFEFFGG